LRAARAGSGEATPAVFLHGFGGDHSGWGLQLAAIAADRPVIALDLPGHGASTKDVGDGSLAALAADVGAALDALGLGKVHLVGHSLGGATALAVALAAPDRIASLSLVCPASVPGTALNPAYIDGFLSAKRGRELAKTLELLFADPSLATREMAEDILKSKRLDGVEEALAAIRAGMAAPAFAAAGARIGEVTAPLLVIASKSDQVVGAPDEAALPAGATVVWASKSGHMPMVEEGDLVSAALAARMA
jgi:pyruvate dehydrogenase E2 component (dihydrolipoamide acetyltransferase)